MTYEFVKTADELARCIPDNCRGVIVLDTNAIRNLQEAVLPALLDADQRDKKPNKFIDILKFLGKNGYVIVVPEMVLYEIAGITSRGKYINDYFPTKKNGLPHEKRDYSNTSLQIMGRDFAQELFKNKLRRFFVACSNPESNSEQAGMLKELNNIIYECPNPCPRATQELVGAQHRYKNENDRGEAHAIELISALHKLNSRPIFFLSDDKKACDIMFSHVGNGNGCNILTTSGFFFAFENAGILPHLGFGKQTTAKNIMDTIRAGRPSSQNKTLSGPADSSLPYQEGVRWADNDRPFFKTIQELARNLNIQSPAKAEAMSPPNKNVQHISGLQRFQKKWGGQKPDGSSGPDGNGLS